MAQHLLAMPDKTAIPSVVTDAEKYEVLDKIGHGSFGIIRKVRRKTDGEILCRKEIQYIKMSQKEREQLHAEFSILSSLRHPNIVAYYHRDHLKALQELHLYMEYCGGGDLGQVIKDLKNANQVADESFVWNMVSQLVSALYRCHYGEAPPAVGDNVMVAPKKKTMLRTKNQIMILHRDLKPENVFLGADGSVKLGDFGLSKLMQSHDFASTYVGTPFYMSPEICAAERYTMHSDIWSLGCIVYELCTKNPPFNAKTHFHLVQKIKEGRFEPLPACYSPELAQLVRSCLSVNPHKRPDTWDLLQLPVVRLLRKEREVVELGAALKQREERALAKVKEAEALLASLAQDRATARQELDNTVRREWEVKARLEIDRQVALEKERLEVLFEAEIKTRVESEVARRESLQQEFAAAEQRELLSMSSHQHGSTAPTDVPTSDAVPALSSISTAPSTDREDSLLAPPEMDSPIQARPAKRMHRTPFARARTQIDSPMDIAMTSPSPMSIASLSLSPRRAAALSQNLFSGAHQNVFIAGTEARARWEPQTLSTLDSDSEEEDASHNGPADIDSEADDVASPTRRPRVSAIPDPFKTRPSLARQRTVPTRRPAPAAPLFAAGAAPRSRSPVSPRRGLPRPSRATNNTYGADEPVISSQENRVGEDIHRAVTNRNLPAHGYTYGSGATQGGIGGRTLVELQQARAGQDPATLRSKKVEDEVARWDLEDEEMPSPFLSRVRRSFPAR